MVLTRNNTARTSAPTTAKPSRSSKAPPKQSRATGKSAQTHKKARQDVATPTRAPSESSNGVDDNEAVEGLTPKQVLELLKKAKGNRSGSRKNPRKATGLKGHTSTRAAEEEDEATEDPVAGGEIEEAVAGDEDEDGDGDGDGDDEWKGVQDTEDEEDEESDGEEEDIGGGVLEEDEEDEGHPPRGRSSKRKTSTAEDQARAAKRVRRIDPEFDSTPRSTMHTPLPQRRQLHRPAEAPTSSQPPPSTPPSTPHTTRLARAPFTPFKPPRKDGKAKQRAASPQTESLLETMDSLFRLYLATHHAFPDSTTTTAEIKAAFLSACSGEPGAPRRALRMEKDPVYADYIRAIGIQRGPQLRGQVRTVAKPLIPGEYQLNGLTKGACAERVQWLKSRARFTFRDVENRKGMFGHPIIAAVIAQQWFGKKTSEGRLYRTHFNPIPLPVIALAATAVHVGLNDWETGVCLPESNKFETTRYRKVYNRHLGSLKKWQRNHPTVCAKRQQELWTSAWAISGGQPVSEEEDSDDFSEGEMNSEGEL